MNVIVRDEARAPSAVLLNRRPGRALAEIQASVLLDLVRGLAALLVLVSHWRNFLFADYPTLPTHPPAVALFYLLTSGGHQAVVIFFVLSGYLISGSILRLVERGAWSWRTYLLHRLTRLWVVLIPGLLLCLLWDTIGIRLHLAPALYGGGFYNHMTQNVGATLSAPVFIGNLFFLQGVAGHPMFGSDGALWSLANEFWYYILFPLGLIAAWHPRRAPFASRSVRVCCALLFLLIAWFVRGGILWMFPVWLAGTLLCVVPAREFSGRVRLAAVAVYVPVLYALAKWQTVSILYTDYLLTVATFALFYILLSATQPVRSSPGERAGRELARFSYTLYVVHMPLLALLAALTVHDTRWLPTSQRLAEAAGLLLLTLAYAYAVAATTEFRTDTLRRSIARRLHLSH